jgi:putative endonuclease
MHPAVYITATRYHSTIYVGVTSALWKRISEHKAKTFTEFTAAHDVHILVWYEHHHSMETAIRREKQLKKRKRDRKIRIIEEMNPDWAQKTFALQEISKCVGQYHQSLIWELMNSRYFMPEDLRRRAANSFSGKLILPLPKFSMTS